MACLSDRVGELLKLAGLEHVKEACDACGKLGLVVLIDGKAKRAPLRCGRRDFCLDCGRIRGERRAAAVKPILDGAKDAGCVALHATLTCQAIDTEPAAKGFADRLAWFQNIRRSRATRAAFDERFAGGILGREVTWWTCKACHKSPGVCKCAKPDLWRRAHVHLHSVLAVQPGRDPDEAMTWLTHAWVAECKRNERFASNEAQKIKRLEDSTLSDRHNDLRGWEAVAYVLKYPCKAAELRTPADIREAAETFKGLRLFQTFGGFHKRRWGAKDAAGEYKAQDPVSVAIRARIDALPAYEKAIVLDVEDFDIDGFKDEAGIAMAEYEHDSFTGPGRDRGPRVMVRRARSRGELCPVVWETLLFLWGPGWHCHHDGHDYTRWLDKAIRKARGEPPA
jgi:hypothetical protein